MEAFVPVRSKKGNGKKCNGKNDIGIKGKDENRNGENGYKESVV